MQQLRLTTRAMWCIRFGYLALIWQGLWPRLLPLCVVLLLGFALTLSGFWLVVPSYVRWMFQALFIGLALLSLYPLFRKGLWPSYQDVVNFLDSENTHAPLRSAHDTLAGSSPDPLTQNLWNAHQQRSWHALAALKPRLPRLNITARDPYALRHMALLACIGACFVAGSDWRMRIASAFITAEHLQALATFRLDGWINPPIYTRLPPVVLDAQETSNKAYRVPVGSEILIRFAGIKATDMTLNVSDGLQEKQQENKQGKNDGEKEKASLNKSFQSNALTQKQFVITKDATLKIKGNWLTRWSIPQKEWAFSVIPDQPPHVMLRGEPVSSSRGNLELVYTAQDDYGLHNLEAVFEPMQPDIVQRAIVAPPRMMLNLPAQTSFNHSQNEAPETTKTLLELAEHPWAGASVKMYLVAKDEAGQETKTSAIILNLPKRTFTQPMAIALSDFRRDIVLDRSMARPVQKALEALQFEPELFKIPTAHYLGLRLLSQSLERLHRRARLTQQPISNEALLEVVDLMWEMAVRIEDGDLSDSERALKAAQQALDKALKEGASPQEIAKLSQELRQAMDRYVKDMQAQNRIPDQKNQSGRKNPNIKTVTPEYLAELLKQIEELAKNGQTAEAQKLLEQLKNIMNNLQNPRAKRPLSAQEQAQRQAMQQAMRDLGALYQDQNNLRDQTFEQDAQQDAQKEQEAQAEQDIDQEQQQNSQLEDQKQDQQSNQKDQKGKEKQSQNQNPASPQKSEKEGKKSEKEGLRERQNQLRDRLQDLQNRLSEQGIKEQGIKEQGMQKQATKEQGKLPQDAQSLLKQAEQGMKQAEQSLQKGQSKDAVDAQGQALDALGKAQRQLAEQMQGQGSGEGEEGEGDPQNAEGTDGEGSQESAQNGKNNPREDPLGRQTRNSRNENGKLTRQGARSSLEIRIEDIIQELRKRMSDPKRLRDEMDYLERLLKAR